MNDAPDSKAMHVYARKDVWSVAEGLMGNPRYRGYVYTRYKKMVDRSTTWKTPHTRTEEHPNVHGEMFEGDWWCEEEV
jgi:hypothetical protein